MDTAVAEVEGVLWRVPHSAQGWFVRAQLAARQGDREKAIRCLQRVIAEAGGGSVGLLVSGAAVGGTGQNWRSSAGIRGLFAALGRFTRKEGANPRRTPKTA
jgi:hypothetical protein